ncbi:MAG: HD domain-containing protein [Chloroflexota bacterium]
MTLSTERILRLADWIAADGMAEPAIGLLAFEHAIQTAELATRAGADDELLVAALLHDVGHAEGGHEHGQWAQIHLAEWFSDRTLWLIEHHITAKRYVCTVEPEYHARLSVDSQQSLRLQGGTLPAEEATVFSQHIWFDDAMRLRRWDDSAKRGGWLPRRFESYSELIESEMERVAREQVTPRS